MDNPTLGEALNDAAVVKYDGPKMDADLKAKWIAALRSGNYSQGRAALRDGDDFCCLGVLCDVAGVKWIGDEYSDEKYAEFDDGDKRSDVLSGYAQDKFGLSDAQHDACWQLNDIDKKSFAEIADYIEANL